MEQLHLEFQQKRVLLVGFLWVAGPKQPIREAVARASAHYLERLGRRFVEVRLNPRDYAEAQVTPEESDYLIADPTVLPKHVYMVLAPREDMHEC